MAEPSSSAPPKKKGLTGDRKKLLLAAAAAGVVLFIYLRSQNSSSSSPATTSTDTGTIAGGAGDGSLGTDSGSGTDLSSVLAAEAQNTALLTTIAGELQGSPGPAGSSPGGTGSRVSTGLGNRPKNGKVPGGSTGTHGKKSGGRSKSGHHRKPHTPSKPRKGPPTVHAKLGAGVPPRSSWPTTTSEKNGGAPAPATKGPPARIGAPVTHPRNFQRNESPHGKLPGRKP